ncbi:MAG: alpha/beta hydrolase, partial [Acutalibacteraceae bacterium]
PYCGFLFTATGSKDLISLLSFVSDKSWFEGFNKNLPVLLIAGSEDPVGQYGKGVREVADKLKSAGVKSVDMKLYDGYRHEILNEPDLFDEVAGDVLSFIKRTCNI